MRKIRQTKRLRGHEPRAQAPGEFIVFAHARSGSTSLVRAMQEHPELHILVEPFNETFTKWRPGAKEYRSLVTDSESLDAHLDEMFAEHTGVKVLDYQMPRHIYTHMLRHPARKVIWLRRMNLLQSVVSVLISEQTGVWHAWDLDAPLDERYADLQPLSIADIRKRIADLRAEVEYYDGVITSRAEDSFLNLTYEDLYLKGPDERERQLRRVFVFLGIEPPPGTEPVMDPDRTKLNSSRTYALLPNAEEIQEEVGSDETGWLFEPEEARQITLIASVDDVARHRRDLPAGYEARPMRDDEHTALAQLYLAAYPDSVVADMASALDEIERTFESEYGRLDRAACIVVTKGASPVAAVMTVDEAPWSDTPPGPFVIEVIVHPDHRRRGLAEHAMQVAAGELASHGRSTMALRVMSDNASARALYRKLGFGAC